MKKGARMTLKYDSLGWSDTYWENIATTRWGSYITGVEKRVILRAHDLAERPTTALEVGCEGGRWSKVLFDLGWDMVCTDIDPDALEICQKRIPAAKCVLVGAKDTVLPCETGGLGLLLCIEVIPVLRCDWFIAEAFRVLRRGGLVVGVFENLLSLRGYVRHLMASAKGELDYYKIAYPSWRNKFRNQGFKMIYEEGMCWFPFSRASNSPLVPVFTQMERYLGLRRLPSLSPWIVFLARKEPSV